MVLQPILKRSHKRFPTFKRWRIVRGDKVQIIDGRKDVGKQGAVKKVNRARNTVTVTGCNMVRKHIKGSAEYRGTIVSIEAPIHVSNIQLVDPATGLPTKVGIMYNEEREKVRVARESGNPIAKPEALKERRNIRREPGPRDTTPDDAVEQTFVLAPAGEGESAE